MIRNIVAIVVGFIAGNVFNILIIILSALVFPLPDGINPMEDMEKFQEFAAEKGLPLASLLMALIAHIGGSFVSGLVCGLIAKRAWFVAAIGIGTFFTLAGIYNLTQIPSPTWFAILDIVLYIPAACLGVMLGGAITGKETVGDDTKAVANE